MGFTFIHLEDEVDYFESLRDDLARSGGQVTLSAPHVPALIDMLEQRVHDGDVPDGVIFDVMMDCQDGIDGFQEAREILGEDMRYVILTNYAFDARLTARYHDAGIDQRWVLRKHGAGEDGERVLACFRQQGLT